MRNRRWLAASGVLVAAAALTACATLPTSGSVQLNTLRGSLSQAQHGVQIVPASPGQGWNASDIVNGFLEASASFDGHRHAVAREYLTARFNRIWRPGWAATIIDSPQVTTVPQGQIRNGGGTPAEIVDVTGKRFAKLQTAGRDQAGSVVVSPGASSYRFSLVQRDGGWRIDGILHNGSPVKPTLLLLTSLDFARDYQVRNLYFYPVHPAADALVPDPVYIPQTGPVAEVKGLVNALIHPPPPSSWLRDAATTAFPPGTKPIRPPQIIGGIKVVVDLGGAAARTGQAQRERMAAQLYWSLRSSPYATQYASLFPSVVLEINHHPVPSPPDRYAALVPRGVPGPLYYQVSGGPEPAVTALPARSAPVQVPLPAGLGDQPFTAMAVSTAQRPPTIAGCLGRHLYLIRLAAAVQDAKKLLAARRPAPVTKQLPASCTSLSWDDRGNLWVTASAHTLLLPAAATAALARAAFIPIQVPWPSTAITTLRVAPDGVRVAMIVGAGQAKRILVAAISRNALFTFIGRTPQMLRVGSDIANPFALTWLDPDHLLVLSKQGGGRTQMFEVPLNGGQSTPVATPGGVMSVAASWQLGRQPHLVIAIAPTASSPGKIEISKTELANPDWVPVAKGATPVFPG